MLKKPQPDVPRELGLLPYGIAFIANAARGLATGALIGVPTVLVLLTLYGLLFL